MYFTIFVIIPPTYYPSSPNIILCIIFIFFFRKKIIFLLKLYVHSIILGWPVFFVMRKVEYIGIRKIITLKQLSISFCADKLSLVKTTATKVYKI